MPVESAADQAIFMADFGVPAVFAPDGGSSSNITVIFDNEYIPVDAGASVSFAMQQPKALAVSSDVPNVSEGDSILIGGVGYIIRVVMPDGTGMTEMMLEIASLISAFLTSTGDAFLTADGDTFNVQAF